MIEYRFLDPVDALYLRGNRMFGGAGDYSEALMPPWPSLAAGALRTRILADHRESFEGFAREERPAGVLGDVLGTPERPGSFRVALFTLGRTSESATSIFFPVPADLIVQGDPETCRCLKPTSLHKALQCSYGLERVPVLRLGTPEKPRADKWLTEKGLKAYLMGQEIRNGCWVDSCTLWEKETRLGIGMDPKRRTADQGRIYTSDTITLKQGVGFIVGVTGSRGLLPATGLVRFGGDGRAATVSACELQPPEPPWAEIEKTGRFKFVLSTPGLFEKGWLPPGVEKAQDAYFWSYRGVRARLVAACLGRAEVISGWDLATGRPKPAIRAVPVGSVYWFEGFQGAITDLKAITHEGLWGIDLGQLYSQRRAQGFNNLFVAAWD